MLWQNILWICAGLAVIFLITMLPGKSLKILGIIGVNLATGLALLFVINLVGGAAFGLPFNWLTLGVSGVLGVPGVAALTVLALI